MSSEPVLSVSQGLEDRTAPEKGKNRWERNTFNLPGADVCQELLSASRTWSSASSFTSPGPLPSLWTPGVLLFCPPGSPQSQPFAYHPSLASAARAVSGMGPTCDLLPGLVRPRCASPAILPRCVYLWVGVCLCVHAYTHVHVLCSTHFLKV